jgi:uncharacterized glyoxalase superfamily protein PhnB
MKLTRLIPMLPVKHLPTSVAFYEKLGFAIENLREEWGFAMLALDDCRLMLDQSINTSPDAPRQGVIYLYPDSIAEYHKQVNANGLEVPELETTFYGHSEFRIEDPDGNRLWIGQPAS